MDLSIKCIFLKEGEKDIFARLSEKRIDTKVFASKFQYLFQKVYNNEVGYYSFKQDDTLYKFIVLPKTISLTDTDKERAFVNYLLHYYRVNNKYGYDSTKKIPNSLLSLAFESNNKSDEIHNPIDIFEFHKTKAILKSIEMFFQKHKNYKRVEQDYISQSIRYKLNLGKNIKEINKSKIHQTKKVDIFYSQIATISYNILKLYIQKKLSYLDRQNSELKQYAIKIRAFIARKYQIDKRFSISLPILYNSKISKVFQKNQEHKMLLINLRSLFGHEQFYNEKQNLAELRQDLTTSSFFIDPSLFYEWYVYDILKNYADDNDKIIQFDKDKNKKTKSVYFLNQKEKSSNPDYILTDIKNKTKVVIDAKWKNVDKLGNIESSDYQKLKFDSLLVAKDGYSVSSYLIYPKVAIDERSFNMKIEDKTVFDFNIIEIDMEYHTLNKGLDFDFDVKKLQDSIDKNSKVQNLKTMSEKMSKFISDERISILSKLIDEEDSDKKEDLRASLDEQLSRSALELSEKIEEQKILPQIEDILTKYDTVLEEESKKFLKSSSAIYSYYKKKSYDHFDYSMPGSGFWKLIELELNTSFIWRVRIINNVCSTDCPWTPLGSSKRAIFYEINPRKKVKLNQYEHNDKKLQGVMLGGIKILLNEDEILDEFSIDSRDFLSTNLLFTLGKIIELRNEHAHIKAMSLEDFEELWKLFFDKVDDNYIFLEKLLDFKKSMRDFISSL